MPVVCLIAFAIVAGSGLSKTRSRSALRKLAADRSGVTAIEYSLIACLIAIVIVSAVQLAGTQVSAVFGEVGNGLK